MAHTSELSSSCAGMGYAHAWLKYPAVPLARAVRCPLRCSRDSLSAVSTLPTSEEVYTTDT